MAREEILENIKKVFKEIWEKEEIMAILLYGSQLNEEYITNRSDIDICIVAPNHRNPEDLYIKAQVAARDPKFDVKIFELLPLYLKVEVIKNHEIIFVRDRLELYEYFYKFRKIWKDQESRNKITREDALYILRKKRKS